MRNIPFVALLGTLVGCGSTLAPDFGDDLGPGFGCGDVWFYAVDDADTTLLRVHAEGLIEAAETAGEETTTTFELPDAAITVQVDVGSRISDAACDDVIENGGPSVDVVYEATGGTATITVRPGTDSEDAKADLHLEDVVFEPEGGGEPVTLERFDVTDVSVGWYAG